MSEEFYLFSKNPVTFAFLALEHFKRFFKKENNIAIEIGISVSGCSGLKYEIKSRQIIPDNYIKFKNDGVLFCINPKNFKYINGLHIDYEKKNLGLFNLVYYNPNESSRCGCGESFKIEN